MKPFPSPSPLSLIVGLILGLCAFTATACGPYFPNRFLMGDDEFVLTAPFVDFRAEIRRIGELRADWIVLSSPSGPARQSAEVEIADLREALQRNGVPAAQATNIVARHAAEREKAIRFYEAPVDPPWFVSPKPDPSTNEPPAHPEVVSGLPEEFAIYFRGWLAWKAGRTNDAIADWERILALPKDERHFKSVWAAYMLGRTKVDSKPSDAVNDLQLARLLAGQGCADHLGLAAASLGWEAKALLNAKRYPEAIDKYLAQLGTGDESAYVSLRWAAAAAVKAGGESLLAVAGNPRTRNVVNAYLLSTGMRTWHDYVLRVPAESLRWLEAVEQVGAQDVSCAEPMALASYNAGDMKAARRWVERAGKDAPVAEWIRAKLFLRDGEAAEAARIIARLTERFPTVNPGTNAPPPSSLAETLRMGDSNWRNSDPVGRHLLGELGVLRLGRGEFVSALDCLLRAGFWSDAAHVAERVLTVDELKAYVDSDWRPGTPKTLARLKAVDGSPTEAEQIQLAEVRRQEDSRDSIRLLLARRLTRLQRGDEARPYFPEERALQLDTYLANLRLGGDATLPNSIRADAYWIAAQILRTNGMELIGTEAAPDWTEHEGNFDMGSNAETRTNRQASATRRVTAASLEELERYDASAAVPDLRFHYRYLAASLGFEAAKLMPNNDDHTAIVLYTAGGWLKDRDPQTADIFYKALVRRCRKTEFGRVADINRWFPSLDENGKPIERRRKPKTVEPVQEEPEPTPATDGPTEADLPEPPPE